MKMYEANKDEIHIGLVACALMVKPLYDMARLYIDKRKHRFDFLDHIEMEVQYKPESQR